MTNEHKYLMGWGGAWQSESLPGALPRGQNSPQKPPYGLYAEQLSGSAFTRPRHQNLRSWLYRIIPSVVHSEFTPYSIMLSFGQQIAQPTPSQLRWDPLPDPSVPTDFIHGLTPWCQAGEPSTHQGAAVYLYAANQSMENDFFSSADGELLFVPYQGEAEIWTEFGKLSLTVGEIAVIPRGVRFQIKCLNTLFKGYVCENYGQPFSLPDLGPIGSNGLANPKDFHIPTAWFEDKVEECRLIHKFQGGLWEAYLPRSPLNVVAWHGNYAPYKYDLRLFNTINTVSFDHCDPSIFTVLTSPSAFTGIANLDFVIFPHRWMVAEHTFRPPYYHRNIMSEYMGLIYGAYDAKGEDFKPGGSSLHNCMSAHGPDRQSFEAGSSEKLEPKKQSDTLAFMFETSLTYVPSPAALTGGCLQKNYQACWSDLKSHFRREP